MAAYDRCVRYRVLGPIELAVGGEVGPLGSQNQERLLAVLLARRNRTVPIDVLVDAIWGDEPPRTAVSTLRTYVSRLRRSVGDALVSERGGYRLAVEPGDLDADRFDELRRDAAVGDPVACLHALDEALRLWRGDAFSGHGHVPAVLAESRRLCELRGATEVRRLQLLVLGGDATAAIASAEARLTVEPDDEPTWVVLVHALVAAGRLLDATRAAQRARSELAAVGLSPGDELLAAEARALGSTSSSHPEVPDSPRRSGARGRAAPRPSSLLGRGADIAAVREMLGRERVVTLVGSGGVGKTRLARDLMHEDLMHEDEELAAPGADVWFVELGHLDPGADVAAALVSALGLVRRDADVEQSLAGAGALEGLLVLDNAEHVVDGVAAAVGSIVSGGSTLQLLVTSREPLAIDGEHVYRVLPLDRADVDAPAQRLFVDRAEAAGVAIDPAIDGDRIDRIVELLDGLPLAIEMAAAQLATCTVRELEDRLAHGVAELSTGRRDVDERHRTLAGVIEWSVGRLADDESDVLRELTVFAGSFTVDDVAAVLGRRAAPLVRRLADRSLLTMSRGTDSVRFAHFHVVREHLASRQPALDERVRSDHARWCVEAVRRADERLCSNDEPAARASIGAMFAEIRAAHQWAGVHDRPRALAMSAGLHRFAQAALHDEVFGWAERLVVSGGEPGDDPGDAAVAFASAASRAVNRGDSRRGVALARTAVELAPHDAAALPALEILADAALYDGRLHEAQLAYRSLYERARDVGDAWYWPMGWSGLALVEAYGGPAVDPELRSAPDDVSDGVPPTARAILDYARAELVLASDPTAAIARLEDQLDLVRSIPSPFSEGIILTSIAAARARSGDPQRALVDHRAAITHWLGLADRSHQATAMRNLVPLLARLESVRPEYGELAAEVLGMLESSGIPTYGVEKAGVTEAGERIRTALGPDRWGVLHARGARRDLIDGARWLVIQLDQLV